MNNTIKYVKILEGAGITRDQAEAHIQIITEVMEGSLATKQDMKNLEVKFDSSVGRLESKSDSSIERLEHKLDTSLERLEHKLDTSIERLEHKLLQMEYRLTIKLGTIVTVVIAAAVTVVKLL